MQFLAVFIIAKFNLVRVEQRSNKIFQQTSSVWNIAREVAVYRDVFLEKGKKKKRKIIPEDLKRNCRASSLLD